MGDQPGVEAAVIDMAVEAWRREPTPIACAAYRGRPGHPLILARALFPLLEVLRGDKAAWKIVDAHPDWIPPVPIDRPAIGDVNTREAYQALRAR